MSDKLLFAVGGTGGHVFLAQALARDLKEYHSQLEILFGGQHLGSNQFFHKLQFPFRNIPSSSPFRENIFKSAFHIGCGIRESFKLFKEFTPNLIVGFGSFYSFPILMAARLKEIPYILVESNAYPGKVTRLFASKALFSATQFKEADFFLKGKTCCTKMPFWSQEFKQVFLSSSEARKYYQLDPNLFTLLVFGGSQGARAINQAVVELNLSFPFQVLHFCGRDQDASSLTKRYEERGIKACVKPFEERMQMAWRAADLTICRPGAGTLTEIKEFQVPAILIPWPGASEKHQHKNAKAMQALGGAFLLDQKEIHSLKAKVEEVKEQLPQMRANLQRDLERDVEHLNKVILNQLKELK